VQLTQHRPPADSLELLKVFRFEPQPISGTGGGRERKKLRECNTHDLVLLVKNPDPILDVLDRNRARKANRPRQPLSAAQGLLALVNPGGRKAGQYILQVKNIHICIWMY
jgi:hypothetical protein